MLIYGVSIESLSEDVTFQNRKCQSYMRLGTYDFYLCGTNSITNKCLFNFRYVPNKMSGMKKNLMVVDMNEPERETYAICYTIPKGYHIKSVLQSTIAYRFRLNDNGKFWFIGREFPELYAPGSEVLRLILFDANGNMRLVKFMVENSVLECREKDYDKDDRSAKYIKATHRNTYIAAYNDNRMSTSYTIKPYSYVLINDAFVSNRIDKSFNGSVHDYLNYFFRNTVTVRDVIVSTSVVSANRAVDEIIPYYMDNANRYIRFIILGFNYYDTKRIRQTCVVHHNRMMRSIQKKKRMKMQ